MRQNESQRGFKSDAISFKSARRPLRQGFSFGAANTWRQSAGICASVIGWLGFGGSVGGFGCSTGSLNQ
jgi:hypothetical protein